MRVKAFGQLAISLVGLALALLALSWLTGCEVRQAQSSIRSALTAADDGMYEAAKIYAEKAKADSDASLERIEADCPRPCPDATARYRVAMTSWFEVSAAIKAAHHSLEAADRAVDVWIAGSKMAPDWGSICDGAAKTIEAVSDATAAATGEPPPAALKAAPAVLRAACQATMLVVVGAHR
uniref:Uncharacterized protein n=1 Tax=viral metagenome TaxID=1070528 RepID=A0A6M3J963_9ZZZZ